MPQREKRQVSVKCRQLRGGNRLRSGRSDTPKWNVVSRPETFPNDIFVIWQGMCKGYKEKPENTPVLPFANRSRSGTNPRTAWVVNLSADYVGKAAWPLRGRLRSRINLDKF
jgi:hypothetical protein